MKKDLPLPASLPAFRRDSDIIAEFRGFPVSVTAADAPDMDGAPPAQQQGRASSQSLESQLDGCVQGRRGGGGGGGRRRRRRMRRGGGASASRRR